MPVWHRAVGWLTGVFLALGGTAVGFASVRPDPTHGPVLVGATAERVLEVSFVVVSSWPGGLAAGAMRRGVKRSGTWSAVIRCMVVGVIVGVATFLLLTAIVAVLLIMLLGHSGIS
jgi:hypothetical protein